MQFSLSHWLKRSKFHGTDDDWHERHCIYLESLVDWCSSKGYEIDFTSTQRLAWLLPDKTILIPSKPSAIVQLMYLLHEAGHVSVEVGEIMKRRFSRGYAATAKYRQLNHVIDVLDEELHAWEQGKKIARRLGIELNEERYNKLRVKHVASYAREVSRWKLRHTSGRKRDLRPRRIRLR